jgi:hypothetical protein
MTNTTDPVLEALDAQGESDVEIARFVLRMVDYTKAIPTREEIKAGAPVANVGDFIAARNLAVMDLLGSGSQAAKAKAANVSTAKAKKVREGDCYGRCMEQVVDVLGKMQESADIKGYGKSFEQQVAAETLRDALFSENPAARSKALAAFADRMSGKAGRERLAPGSQGHGIPEIPKEMLEVMRSALELAKAYAPDKAIEISASRIPLPDGGFHEGDN